MDSGVGRALGISEESCADLIEAYWERWKALVPALGCVPEPQSIEAWLKDVPRPVADGVLCGLVELAAETGHDDRDAALVLAWMLHPGADALGIRLSDLGSDVFQHVAAFLWIEIRTFSWQTKAHVAANVLLRVRQRVLLEYGALWNERNGYGGNALGSCVHAGVNEPVPGGDYAAVLSLFLDAGAPVPQPEPHWPDPLATVAEQAGA